MAEEENYKNISNISSLCDIFSDRKLAWDYYFHIIYRGFKPICFRHHTPKFFTIREPCYYYWRCSKCRTKESVFKNTTFAKNRIPIHKLLKILLFYWIGLSIRHISLITGIHRHTVGYWASLFRSVCTQLWNKNQEPIGGEGVDVEIDEAIWRRRKYHCGRAKKQIWIFGGIERKADGAEKKKFVIIVPNRKAETLIPIIKEKIKIESTIFSDQWKAYAKVGELGYTHKIVCHKRNFMDPETKACTSTIEGFWSSLRSSFPRHGCREKFLSDYLSLFMIRQQNKYTFDEILEEIVHFKPDKEQEDDDEEEIPFEVEDDEHIPDEYDVLHGEDLSESDSDDLGAGDGSDASEYEG